MLMKMNTFRFYIFILSALFLTACSSINGPLHLYDGAEKADNEIATFIFPAALDALEFDGHEIKSLPSVSGTDYQLKVLPGKHSLKVVYSEVWGGSAMGSLEVSNVFYFTLDVKAGNRYVFKHDAPEDLVHADFDKAISDVLIWIEKENSSEKITAVSRGEYKGFIVRFLGLDESGKAERVDGKTIQEKATEQLAFWWKLTELKQREQFKRWLTDKEEITLAADLPVLQKKAMEQLRFWWKIAKENQRNSFLEWAGIE